MMVPPRFTTGRQFTTAQQVWVNKSPVGAESRRYECRPCGPELGRIKAIHFVIISHRFPVGLHESRLH